MHHLQTADAITFVCYRLLMFGVLCAFYVANCIYYSREVRAQGIPGKHIPWPSWAWCLGIAASLLWLLASIFMLGKHVSCEKAHHCSLTTAISV